MSDSVKSESEKPIRPWLEQTVVRTDEWALIDDQIFLDVGELAACANSGVIETLRVIAGRDEFFASCERVMRKSRLLLSDGALDTDFLEAQLIMPALGIATSESSFVIVDGRKRGEQFFAQYPDGKIEIILVPPRHAARFMLSLEAGDARVMKAMRDRPLWVASAADDVSGGDIVSFSADMKMGRPSTEGIGAYLSGLAAMLGLEVVDREKARRSQTRRGRGQPLDYDLYLSSLRTHVGNKEYSAFHVVPDNGQELARERDGGRYSTFKRRLADSRKWVESYLGEIGDPGLAGRVLDWCEKSDEELCRAFVLVTRAHAAFLQNRSGERHIGRTAGGRGGNPTGDQFEKNVIGAINSQQGYWLDFDAQIELARNFGINCSKFFRNMQFVSDLLQWNVQIFYLSHGAWRTPVTQGEAQQYLMWRALCVKDTQPSEGEKTRFHREWREVIDRLRNLPVPRMDADLPGWRARDYADYICGYLIQERRGAIEAALRDAYSKDVHTSGFLNDVFPDQIPGTAFGEDT